MKPLRDLVLVSQNSVSKEEKTASGLVLLSSEAANYNFSDDGVMKMDVVHKKEATKKDLTGRLIEASKKATGNHLEFYPGGGQVNMAALENNERLKDIVWGRKHNSGTIISKGNKCNFFKEGDEVIFKKSAGKHDVSSEAEDHILIQESDILVKKEGDKYTVAPESIIVKISKESRDNVFKRKFKNENGEDCFLFIPAPTDEADERHPQFFVTCGQVVLVGEKVKSIQAGDTCILDYSVDNNENIIIGYEGEDKLIVVNAVTTRHTDYEVVHTERRTQIVSSPGDYKETSSVLGVIRGEELISIDPFVFINHESTVVSQQTASGIHYTEDKKIVERTILAISKESEDLMKVRQGEKILVDDFDLFDLHLDGRTICCINDIDIIGKSRED